MFRQLAAATAILAVAVLSGCAASHADGVAPAAEVATDVAGVVGPVSADAVGEARAEPPAARVVPDIPVAPATVDNLPIAPEPARLRLDRLDIDMRIIDVGIAKDGSMELPKRADRVGWFRLGGNPGGGAREGTNVVMAAHVDDAVIGLGPFARLRDAKVGDRIVVTLDGGTRVRYQVERVEQTSKQDVDLADVFRSEDSALVLVTCGGRWDADVRHYEDNVLVWAYPEGSR